MLRDVCVCLFLIGATTAAYWPVQQNGFVALDDYFYVVDNELVHDGITLTGLKWAMMTGHAANWHPVTWVSHMLDCQLFGHERAQGHHLSSLVLHIVNALLTFFLLRLMTGAYWQSAIVAAVFALHPVHVESVAWVSERKDVLSTTFWLLHILAYVKYTRRESSGWYGLSLLCLALGLMAKPMLVTAPFLLLLLDYWPLGRFQENPAQTPPDEAGTSSTAARIGQAPASPSKRARVWQLIDEKLSMFLLVLASSVITFFVQRAGGMVVPHPFWHRFATAATAYVRYVGKTFWPTDLACLYPNHVGMWQIWQLAGALGILALITIIVFVLRDKRYLTVGWLWYLGTLVPVIGLFVHVGGHSMADRYLYMPMTGLLIMVVWGAADLTRHWAAGRLVAALAVAAVIAACLWLTPAQVQKWKDTETLFEYAISVTDRNDAMHADVAEVYLGEGQIDQAITHFTEALRIKPDNAAAHAGLGMALYENGRGDEAIRQIEEAMRLDPQLAYAHMSLGTVLQQQGRLDEAARSFQEALRLEPTYLEAHYRLGLVRLDQRRLHEAARHFRRALQLKPSFAEGHNQLGVVLGAIGQNDEALDQFREALRLDPDNARARQNLKRFEAMVK